MAFLPAVTAVLLVPVKRGNGGSAAVTAIVLVPVKRGNGGSASRKSITLVTRYGRTGRSSGMCQQYW
jgi:hypothetical protein